MTEPATGLLAGTGGRSVEIAGLTICYDDRVLEPRPWTVAQSAWASSLLAALPPGPVLELCSGAGHIGLVAVREHDRRLVQVDADPVACAFAVSNAARAGLGDRVDVRCERLEDAVLPGERFALVVADPPWVPSAEVSRFPDDPVTAIDGGATGMELVLRCLEMASRATAPGGACLLQVGTPAQVRAVTAHVVQHEELGLSANGARCFDRGAVVRLDRA